MLELLDRKLRRLLSILLIAIPLWGQGFSAPIFITAPGPTINIVTNNANKAFIITLTGNIPYVQTDVGSPGTEMYLNICQDNVGGHTWTWPGGFRNPPTILSGANQCSPVTFVNTGGGIWQNKSVGNGLASGGGGTTVNLQTNSVANTSQTTLNLKNGTGSSLTADGVGGVTFNVTQGSNYQTVDVNHVATPTEPVLDFALPFTFTDNTGVSTLITMPNFVEGAGHHAGLASDPGAVSGTLKFLREDNAWVVPTAVAALQNPLTSGGLSNSAFPLQINGDVANCGVNPVIDIRCYGARSIFTSSDQLANGGIT